MKSYTITCHDVYNYGASLQAYSLQRYLLAQGVDSLIINYKPDYLSRHFSLWGCSHPKYNRPFIRTLYNIALLPERIKALKKKRLFDEFTKIYLKLTPKKYTSNEEIKSEGLVADLFIAGSDQIWNTLFKNGLDPAFYLDFAQNGHKISYAASFATDKIYNDASEFVKTMIGSLSAVSVRESSALDILTGLGIDNGELVVDPVFLTEKEQWESIIGDRPKMSNEYILLYDCERSDNLKEIALYLKQQTGLPILCIGSTCRKKYWDIDLRLSGPLEFLQYIRDASVVVTNSFHATAFSVIFEKDFYVVNRSSGINARMRDFLKTIDLSDRLVTSKPETDRVSIDYLSVRPLLSQFIDLSKNFINAQIRRTL